VHLVFFSFVFTAFFEDTGVLVLVFVPDLDTFLEIRGLMHLARFVLIREGRNLDH